MASPQEQGSVEIKKKEEEDNHPLRKVWVMWYFKRNRSRTWDYNREQGSVEFKEKEEGGNHPLQNKWV